LHGFSESIGLKWGFSGQNEKRGGAMLTLNSLVFFYFWGFLPIFLVKIDQEMHP